MPPLLNIPARAADLEAVQRGGHLILNWTVPSLTTEGAPLKELPRAVLLVAGEEAALAEPAAEREVLHGLEPGRRAEHRLPVPPEPGRRLYFAVRHDSRRGRSEGLSNVVVLEIAPPLPAPARLAAAAAPEGVRLSWDPVPQASGYQVFRRGPDQKEFAPLGDVTANAFTDPGVVWKMSYRYFVRPFVRTSSGQAEGSDSQVAEIAPQDRFPPAAPAGLQAAATESAVDLTWNLSPEPDVAGYLVYRDGARLTAAPLAAPAFSDRDVRRAQGYSYEVSAVDREGNESPRSSAAKVTIP
jgi:fibronectin type 3 domain-containing protein